MLVRVVTRGEVLAQLSDEDADDIREWLNIYEEFEDEYVWVVGFRRLEQRLAGVSFCTALSGSIENESALIIVDCN